MPGSSPGTQPETAASRPQNPEGMLPTHAKPFDPVCAAVPGRRAAPAIPACG
jgi:hypothetical protein